MPTVTAPADHAQPSKHFDEMEPSPEPPPPPEPTQHLPGTEGKLIVMEWRAANGFSLWHPDNARGPAPVTTDYRCHLHTYREPRVYRCAAAG